MQKKKKKMNKINKIKKKNKGCLKHINKKRELSKSTHKQEEEVGFLRLALTALTLTLRIWQSANKERGANR